MESAVCTLGMKYWQQATRCLQVSLYRESTGMTDEEEASQAGRLSFVDLAGSERANRTGNVGARLK